MGKQSTAMLVAAVVLAALLLAREADAFISAPDGNFVQLIQFVYGPYLKVAWQASYVDACDFTPFPGLTCIDVVGTTYINAIQASEMFQQFPPGGFAIDGPDWSTLQLLGSLTLDLPYFTSAPTPSFQMPPFLISLVIGPPTHDSITASAWYLPSNAFSSIPFLESLIIQNTYLGCDFPLVNGQFLNTFIVSTLPLVNCPLPDIVYDPSATGIVFYLFNAPFTGPLGNSMLINWNPGSVNTFVVTGTHLTGPIDHNLILCTYFSAPISCAIEFNDVCLIGQNQASDISLGTGLYGILGGSCPSGYPCSIGRDNYDCLDCHGTESGTWTYDICDVCLSPSDVTRDTSCLDCLGEANGPHSYDACDVCLEDDSPSRDLSCRDCAGTPNGPATYDSCDVCNGGDSELDCFGVCYGTATYDVCDVCGGYDDCLDCQNVPFGTSVVDDCGICNGLDSCFPCEPEQEDACGVCFGDDTSCADCAGVPNGSAVYDSCLVCGGLDTEKDCAGVCFGTETRDACDVCGGDGTSCADCAGVPNGSQVVDSCGVCGGVNACLDCEGTFNGFAVYDRCDVCDGDGQSCVDCTGAVHGTAVYDRCDICNGPDANPCPFYSGNELDSRVESLVGNVTVGLILTLLICCFFVLLLYALFHTPARAAAAAPRGETRPRRGSMSERREGEESESDSDGEPEEQQLLRPALPPPPPPSGPPPSLPSPPGQTRPPPLPPGRLPPPLVAGRAGGARRKPAGRGSSSLFTALSIVALLASGAEATPQNTAQFFALMTTYTNARTVYPEWYVSSSSGPTLCTSSLPGLTCGLFGTIAAINFDRTLTGTIPVPLFAELPDLMHVRIYNSPFFLFTLDGIEGADNLVTFSLVKTGVHGTLPSAIGDLQKLRVLEIADGHLTGGFPTSMNQFGALSRLVLRDLELTCHLPPAVVGNWLSLTVLDLRGNDCGGGIPAQFAAASALQVLRLDNNFFHGDPFPAGMLTKPYLVVYGISSNQFSNDDFSALTTANYPLLEELYLDDNELGPQLPCMDHFSSLRKLGLSHNQFSTSCGGVAGEFDLGVPDFGPLSLLRVNNNQFSSLGDNTDASNINGVCDFRNNLLCLDTYIPYEYYVLRCTFNLLDNVCGTCGDYACVDCLGVPHGTASLDPCGVCNGNGYSCIDCLGLVAGTSVYDACDVCDGDDTSCVDCAGVIAGGAVYDRCDVCNGDDSVCADCSGTPNGPSVYDACDVCNGDGLSCADCAGVIGGSSLFDVCGVCNGNGTSCENALQLDVARVNADSFVFFIILVVIASVLLVIAGIFLFFTFCNQRGKKRN